MRISCNGCRALRKGCSDECAIRPCLQWISSADSQVSATLFLAKFYGRAGLLNLISAGPDHLRPACGRIVDPVYGSVGLLCSGNWAKCQAAVDAVLKSLPITKNDGSAPPSELPLRHRDSRHVSKKTNIAAPGNPHKVTTRTRFKKTEYKLKAQAESGNWAKQEWNVDSAEEESTFSVETMEASLVKKTKLDPVKFDYESDDGGVFLELTLATPLARRFRN